MKSLWYLVAATERQTHLTDPMMTVVKMFAMIQMEYQIWSAMQVGSAAADRARGRGSRSSFAIFVLPHTSAIRRAVMPLLPRTPASAPAANRSFAHESWSSRLPPA